MASPRLQGLLLLLVFVSSATCTSFYGQPIFSSVIPYFWERNISESIAVDSGMTITHLGKTCSAIYVDAVLRHGTRNPIEYYIDGMNALQAKLRNTSVIQRYPAINTWVDPFSASTEGQLADVGKTEHYTLGKRFLSRFHSLLASNPNLIKYYATSIKRTQDSAKYFREGVTGQRMSDDISSVPSPVVDDKMLRFFDNCKKYSDSVVNNRTSRQEYYNFKKGPEMTAVVQGVSARLAHGEFNLNTDEVLVMLEYCAYELALFNSSIWCQFFTRDDLETITYMYDIYDYWMHSYGHAINSKITCPLLKDVFGDMDKAILANSQGKYHTMGSFRFGHAETLAHVYTSLSLFKDNHPLLATNYMAQRNRTFDSSLIEPFAANIFPVLYKCGDTLGDIYLKMFVNEEAIEIPACQDQICPYNALKRHYSDSIENCRFDQFCLNSASMAPSVILEYSILLLSCFLYLLI